MRRFRALWMRLVRGRRDRREFQAELESHVQMHVEDGMREGLSEQEARRRALIRLGGAEQARQAYREGAGLPGFEMLMQDVRFAFRGLRRNPVFVVTAIATLALGVGATTAVFSVVDRILFRSLPYAHPDRLVSVGVTAPIIPQEFMLGGWYRDWREHQKPAVPNQDPMGQHIKPTPNDPWYTVVGVAADAKNSGLAEDMEPEYYQLRRNNPEDWQQAPSAALVVKTSLAPQAVAQWIRVQIDGIDPTLPVDVQTLKERVSQLADRPRFETALLAFFAVVGLLMAVIGLYGVIAYMAVQRNQEIGVRIVLGAGRTDILRLVLSEGLRLVAAGTLLGLAAALAVSRVLRSILFHVGPYDPASYIAVAVLLALVAFAATLIPARAAMKTDPMAALRVD